jgi:hypothetical protein
MLQKEENEIGGAVKLAAKDGSFDNLGVKEAGDLARKGMLEKQKELCEVSQALALLSSVSVKFQ